MGVDHTAFVCYGLEVTGEGLDEDRLDSLLWSDPVLKPLGLGVQRYGAECYGGTGGYILYVRETYQAACLYEAQTRNLPPAPENAGERLMEALRHLTTLGINAPTTAYGWKLGMWMH